MHCADVLEELAAAAEPASAAVAEHLVICPQCAAWAQRDARLMQLWEATRPQEPSPQAWARVWADLTLTRVTAPVLAPAVPLAPMRPWQRWAPATLALAQAAVLLIGALWLGSQPGPATAAVAMVEIPASDGALVMIHADGTDMQVVSLVAEGSNTIDGEGYGALVEPNFVMLGKLEAMAE
jgi:predicted anti-sigma-YlaC factor YlaD